MARTVTNELGFEWADGRRWESSGFGTRSINAANNIITSDSSVALRAYSTATFTATAGQWYAAVIEVLAVTGAAFTQANLQIDNSDENDQGNARLINVGVGTYCVRFKTNTTKVINFDFGLGTNGNDVAGKTIQITQPSIQKIDSISDVPSRYALPQMKSALTDDKSGTTVAANGLITFGAGVPVVGDVNVVLVHSDSFSNEPQSFSGAGEWGFRLNQESNLVAYIDAVSGRTLATGQLTVANSVQLTNDLQAIYSTSEGTLRYPLIDTNVILPSILVIDMGVNDVNDSETLIQIQASFESEVSNAKAVNPDLIIIVNNVAPWKNNSPGWTSGKQIVQDGYASFLVSRVATDDNMYLNDIFALMGEPGDLEALAAIYDSGDGLHPNSLGSQVIADSVISTIASIFALAPTLTTPLTFDLTFSLTSSLTG